MKIKVVLEPSEEGGFTVYVPSLPGCISEGDTAEEALANIKEARRLENADRPHAKPIEPERPDPLRRYKSVYFPSVADGSQQASG